MQGCGGKGEGRGGKERRRDSMRIPFAISKSLMVMSPEPWIKESLPAQFQDGSVGLWAMGGSAVCEIFAIELVPERCAAPSMHNMLQSLWST